MITKNIYLLIATISVATTAQILIKQGVDLYGSIGLFQLKIKDLIELFISPYILSGLILYVLATYLTVVSLSNIELSIFVLAANLGLIITIILSYFLFNEPITMEKIIGGLLILGGVSVILR